MKFQFWSRKSSQSGQALIEYILVVSISVLIVATLAQKLYKPMDQFVQSIMGTYIQCLLETGELPRLGATSEGTGECQIFQFEVGENGEVQRPTTQKKDRDEADSDKVTDASEGNGGGGRSRRNRVARSGGPRGPRSSFRMPGGQGTAGVDGSIGGGKRIEVALEGGGAGSYFRSANGGGRGGFRREKYVAIIGAVSQEIAKKNQAREKMRSTVVNEGGLSSRRNAKLPLRKPTNDTKPEDDSQVASLDISQIVKIILIAGIIIVLLVLIGGQAMQLSKSWEKGE